jgi:hypothetical protein
MGVLANRRRPLLPRLLAGRAAGPVFLAGRLPTRATATLDLDPPTGRARLSYRRAAALFAEHTGWTLHQLRTRRSPTPPRTAPTCPSCWPAPATPPSVPWSVTPASAPKPWPARSPKPILRVGAGKDDAISPG